ncbi:protein kinase, putative [Trypanosoma brucei gambiense DAL972]|uniref:Serine/threonine protein kinase, putative n=1 Tax=Trypanosoma brucei gambiense (strain MHOM/CI/86/DAL972) TaxID=679716 RepID=C9ZLF2_TRYB9|nr:protein kinase, putative [Trypanosoma brucei gambiense DAL972]CBH10161.1 protein kinase, putative [Trypanosoma brucei gambiense DAL972]|eukprot:XP_011772451.1 protein kinase, putative [Trypanosoma brucei gambiense DAL972]
MPEGEQAIGSYVIGKTIGKGSFGKVKEATHIPTGHTVAVKMINRDRLEHAKMDEKVAREIKILQLFSHPNICRLYEVIYTTTEIFLIMEYVECGELFQHIVNQGKLRENEARYIFQQIICAVNYCHNFLVAHRDLKPENILLGPGLQVKLIDFGLSNIAKDGEFLQTSCGSPNYAAPEVIDGRYYVGSNTDIWSCGVILYALLCGSLPFDESDTPSLFRKIKSGSYKIPAHVSSGARDLIEKILVVDPVHRLTIPQIYNHQWFVTNLPARLWPADPRRVDQQKRISTTAAAATAKYLNRSDREVRAAIREGRGEAFVAYSIIFDAEQRKILSNGADEILNKETTEMGCTTYGTELTHVPRATERELHLGLLLTQSPVMESLLGNGDVSSNKHAYNGSNFVPASMRETHHGAATAAATPPNPGGVFFIGKRADSYAETSGTLDSSYREDCGSTNPIDEARPGCSRDSKSRLSSGNTERQRVGSVAKSDVIYTREEREFIVKNNVGWRIGLMADLTSSGVMRVVYEVLKRYAMEWKSPTSFELLVRPTAVTFERIYNPLRETSSWDSAEDEGLQHTQQKRADRMLQVVILIHLFRIRESHDDGYILDFSVLKGSVIALDIVRCLFCTLVQKLA